VLLAGSLLVSAGSLAHAQDETAGTDQAGAASPAPVVEPEPTPYPQFDPSSVSLRLDLVSDEFDGSVYVTDDGLPRSKCLYVIEKDGQVWMYNPGEGFKAPRPFLDIRRLVGTGPEQGLHSIAFHPRFGRKGNGRYFAHYTDTKGAAVVAEFNGAPCKPAAKKASKPKIWINESQDFPNNNAGWIGFGPDGKLYVPLGDGGGTRPGDPNGNGQSPRTRLSKVLRLDVARTDGIARDNPYVQVRNGKLRSRGGFPRETWAWGLRDPRRASFDRETGDFWIGDVGQDHLEQVGWEEVNLVRAGSVKNGRAAPNFGWSHVEGESACHPVNAPDCDPALYTPPVFAYEKVAPNRAITGGYVYRGEAIPELQGVYFFSDFASGIIWGLDADAVYEGVQVPAHQLFDAPQGFVSFGEDDAGELYLVTLDGSIYQLSIEGR
jgi:glucose/arabinose dehydrogenase